MFFLAKCRASHETGCLPLRGRDDEGRGTAIVRRMLRCASGMQTACLVVESGFDSPTKRGSKDIVPPAYGSEFLRSNALIEGVATND